MFRKEKTSEKISTIFQGLFWIMYILYVPVCVLFFMWMLIVEFMLPYL